MFVCIPSLLESSRSLNGNLTNVPFYQHGIQFSSRKVIALSCRLCAALRKVITIHGQSEIDCNIEGMLLLKIASNCHDN